jgi:hypothetical protein
MNKTLRSLLFPLSTCLGLALACSSSSSSPSKTDDAGDHTGGDSGGGGGSKLTNGGCESLADGQVIECIVFRIDGKSDTTDQAGCKNLMATYVATCPTENLVGCCTTPAATGIGTASTEQCYYNAKIDGGQGCILCGIGPDGGAEGAAQAEATCKMNAGTGAGVWTTTP